MEEERRAKLKNDAATKWLRLAMKTDKERKARLEKMVATKRLSLAVGTEKERKARLEKMVPTAQLMLALIKGVVDVGMVFIPQTHSERLATMLIVQNLMFKQHRDPQLKEI